MQSIFQLSKPILDASKNFLPIPKFEDLEIARKILTSSNA